MRSFVSLGALIGLATAAIATGASFWSSGGSTRGGDSACCALCREVCPPECRERCGLQCPEQCRELCREHCGGVCPPGCCGDSAGTK